MQRVAMTGAGLSGVVMANGLKNDFEIALLEKLYSPSR